MNQIVNLVHLENKTEKRYLPATIGLDAAENKLPKDAYTPIKTSLLSKPRECFQLLEAQTVRTAELGIHSCTLNDLVSRCG